MSHNGDLPSGKFPQGSPSRVWVSADRVSVVFNLIHYLGLSSLSACVAFTACTTIPKGCRISFDTVQTRNGSNVSILLQPWACPKAMLYSTPRGFCHIG